jgi:putative membrane protein
MLRLTLASLHLLALGIGLGAVWGRSRALRGPVDAGAVRRALATDTWWAVAAVLWVATGLWRLVAGTEKATEYYLANHWFLAKMGLFGLVVVLEVWPAITFTRWRSALRRGATPDTESAPELSAISVVQAVLVALMIGVATAMARGYGVGPATPAGPGAG